MNGYQIFMGIGIGMATVLAFYLRSQAEDKLNYESLKPGQKTCLVEPLMLPMMLGIILAMILIFNSIWLLPEIAVRLVLLFLHISIYYGLLLLALPLLRRVISARACAELWLVPTLLYFMIYLVGVELRPLFVLTLSRRALIAGILLWACGFACVMLWQIAAHLRFRRLLLDSAVEFKNPDVLTMWHVESRRHGVKREIPVLVSAEVNTPLTVGCFDGSMRLVLPDREYSRSEYALIFRHELRHILRCDTRVKMFLGFCTAMCWFNPLAWVARRRVADDLELSCDEAILSYADESTRRQYSELLLRSAGDERGYTTCLSANAAALRYRLRNVMKPRRRLSGAIFVGFAICVLIQSFGAVALADGRNTVQREVFDQAPSGLQIDWVSVGDWNDEVEYRRVYGYDAAELTEYLSALEVQRVYTGNYEAVEDKHLSVDYAEMVNGEAVSFTRFDLYDDLLFVNIPYDNLGSITYLLKDQPDWTYLNSLLDFEAENPDPDPVPPQMTVTVTKGDVDTDESLHAVDQVIRITDDNGHWVMKYSETKTEQILEEPGEEQKPTHWLYDRGEGVGGFFGAEITEVQLGFSYEPVSYVVLVENWDRSESYTLNSEQLAEGLMPLAPYSAHYTVRGSFDTVRNTHYEMAFYFDIGLPGDEEI